MARRSSSQSRPDKLRDAFAADLPTEQTALMAATQRPVAEAAFSEPTGPPAWKRLPSWTVLATGDKAAGTDVIRSQAERAGATITEIEGSHVIMISQPQAVTDVILARSRRSAAPGGTLVGQTAGSSTRQEDDCDKHADEQRGAESIVWTRQPDRGGGIERRVRRRRPRLMAPAVVLLHGWPYDIHSYERVTPLLAADGYRVIVPYLRGHGTTRFLSEGTVRNGEQAVLAVDAIALLDALGIKMAIVAGFDWGARSADIVAALWPERVSGLVSVSGYLIGSQEAGRLAPVAAGRAAMVVPVLLRHRTWPGRLREVPPASSPGSSGERRHRSGISMRRPSTAAQHRSIIRITSRS